MKLLLSWIICLFKGHHYIPSCAYEYEQRQNCPRGRVHNERFRYCCVCCNKSTGWMSAKQHKAFELKYNPTWGGRGSDSQGRRSNTDGK